MVEIIRSPRVLNSNISATSYKTYIMWSVLPLCILRVPTNLPQNNQNKGIWLTDEGITMDREKGFNPYMMKMRPN